MWDLTNYLEMNPQKVYMSSHYLHLQILCIKSEDV